MRLILYTGFLFIAFNSCAQSSYQFGLLPAFNLNKKLNNGWKINTKIESRQLLKEGVFKEPTTFDYQHGLLDIAIVGSKKIGINNSLATGYLIRFRDGEQLHRLIQQYTITNRLPGFRLAHRIASDQSFQKDKDPGIRLRYRLSVEFPLNGQTVDPQEFYIKINHEYLNAFQSGDYDLETRLSCMPGYKITDNNKLEFGLDYRLSSFIDGPSKNRFWIALNWYVAI